MASKFFSVCAIFAIMAVVIVCNPVKKDSKAAKAKQELEELSKTGQDPVIGVETAELLRSLVEGTADEETEAQFRSNVANLFNLSAALAGAPTNSASLGFIPLITLLFG